MAAGEGGEKDWEREQEGCRRGRGKGLGKESKRDAEKRARGILVKEKRRAGDKLSGRSAEK